MSSGWSPEDANTFWSARPSESLLQHPVSERCCSQLDDRKHERAVTLENSRQTFYRQHHLEEADGDSIIQTREAQDLAFWVQHQSWTYCTKCLKLDPRKLPQSFSLKTATRPDASSKCGNSTYCVPTADDIPLFLRRLTAEDQRILLPFNIHSDDYICKFNSYRQRTGPFRVSWCQGLVEKKIADLEDPVRRRTLFQVYEWLMGNRQSSYSIFARMHSANHQTPFL